MGLMKGNVTNIALILNNLNVDTFCKSYHLCLICLMLYKGNAIFFRGSLLV